MPYQPITATIAPADVTAIKAAIATIQAKLPFLITLTDAERKSLSKIGQNSLSFVEHAQTGAANNPTILPGSFDAAGFSSHVDLFATLTDINTSIAQLADGVDDTRMAVGSEAMGEARSVYEYVKAAAKTTPGLKPVADQLGERFQRTSAAKAAPTAAKQPKQS
jgi:hypothetical protein